MITALAWAMVVFGVVFVGLGLVERGLHRWRHNPDTSYRWGVWLFSILAAIYTFITALGR